MKRVTVDSTVIASIGYDARSRELEVVFRQSGDVYRYSRVSVAEYAEFMAAESKGSYLNQVFKLKRHPFSVVRQGRM